MDTKTKKGFTLIELLVVVAIIAVLVSILLPALSTARQLAQGLNCLNQLRQVSLATQSYASDNNMIVFIGTAGTPPNTDWRRWMQPLFPTYLNDHNIIRCPYYPPYEKDLNFHPINGNWRWYAYGIIESENYVYYQDGACRHEIFPGDNHVWTLNMQKLTEPSMCIVHIDSVQILWQRQRSLIQPYVWDNTYAHLRHLRKANADFADGHAEMLNVSGLAKYGFSCPYPPPK